MPTDFGFRFSTYLALGLACATLGYSEYMYLPSVTAFTVVVLCLMVVAFRRDGGNEISLATANRVGLVIGIAVIAYLAFQYFQPGLSLLDKLPFPAGLLPYLGPVFLVLIPAKLFRPKHVGDWWAMHGVGLAVVCLACVMEDDTPLAVLVTAYLVVGVWSLMLFYFRRGGGAVTPIPRGNGHRMVEPVRVVSAADAPPKSRFGGIRARRPVSYLLVAAAAGFVFFILTPRTDSPHWSLSMYREVGYSSDEQAPDLTRTGDLKDNRDRAFEVTARNGDGTPKLDVDGGQRWRGSSFVEYKDGKWSTQKAMRATLISSYAMPARLQAASLLRSTLEAAGPDAYYLEFELNGKRRDPVQADPVWWQPGGLCPISTKVGNVAQTWFQRGDGSIAPPGGLTRSPQYRQVTRPPVEPDLSPAFQVARGMGATASAAGAFPPPPQPRLDGPRLGEEQLYLATVDNYRYNPLPRLRTWTEQLIVRLTAEGKLPKEVADRYSRAEGTFPVADFEAVARAINDHFVTSGEFTYATENTRSDKSLDPVEDFVQNTKSGSCEWYATALTLCLRSVGLPAQCVLGFKGCEAEEDGRYTVRQDHAHAWVEVLIARPAPPGFVPAMEFDAFRNLLPPPTKVWHWLTLDPTPGGEVEAGTAGGFTGLWGSFRTWWTEFFNDYVIRYDPDRRERAGAAAEKWFGANWRPAVVVVLGLASAAVGGLILRRYFRKEKAAAAPLDPVPGWYRQFLSAAAGAGLTPAGGETPREFADRVIATVPPAGPPATEVTDVLYRVRYAGESDLVAESLRPTLDRFAQALSGVSPTGRGV